MLKITFSSLESLSRSSGTISSTVCFSSNNHRSSHLLPVVSALLLTADIISIYLSAEQRESVSSDPAEDKAGIYMYGRSWRLVLSESVSCRSKE